MQESSSSVSAVVWRTLKTLSENGDFERVDFEVRGYRSEGGMLTLIPSVTHTDGFFIAKLIRKK